MATKRAAARPKDKVRPDWDRIRAEYEIGGPNNSVRSIAARHGISHTAINKRIKAESWPEPGDLDEVIRQKVSAKVSGVVSSGNPQKKAEAIDAEAERRAAVVRRHQDEWEEIETLRQEALAARFAKADDLPDDGDREAGKEPKENPTERAFAMAKLAKITAELTAIKQAGQRKAFSLDAKGDDKGSGALDLAEELRVARERAARS